MLAQVPPCGNLIEKDSVQMTELNYIAGLESRWPEGETPTSAETISAASMAVRDFPNSAKLWYLRGQLIWRAEEDYSSFDRDFVKSNEKAIELDPSMSEAYDALAGYYDGIKDDPERAMEYYRKAAALRGEKLD